MPKTFRPGCLLSLCFLAITVLIGGAYLAHTYNQFGPGCFATDCPPDPPDPVGTILGVIFFVSVIITGITVIATVVFLPPRDGMLPPRDPSEW